MRWNRSVRLVRAVLLGVVCFVWFFSALSAQAGTTFRGLGNNATRSTALGISADGLVVVGRANLGPGRGVRWTEAEGWTVSFAGSFAGGRAWAASADGSAMVGRQASGPVHWTEAGGVVEVPLGPLAGDGLGNNLLSADGSVLVGSAGVSAARWTEAEGVVSLGWAGSAVGISGDASVIVGNNNSGPVRWTESGGLTALGCASYDSCEAWGISANGLIALGYVELPGGQGGRPARWAASGSLEVLTFSPSVNLDPAEYHWAVDASYDGSVIVGELYEFVPGSNAGSNFNSAWIWKEGEGGIRTIESLLTDAGVTSHVGWDLWRATGISDDGRTVVGDGFNPDGVQEAWLVTLVPEPTTALLLTLGLAGLGMRRRGWVSRATPLS